MVFPIRIGDFRFKMVMYRLPSLGRGDHREVGFAVSGASCFVPRWIMAHPPLPHPPPRWGEGIREEEKPRAWEPAARRLGEGTVVPFTRAA